MIKSAVEAIRSLHIEVGELTFEGGTTVPLAPSGVVLIVGPNNSGKSTTLTKLHAAMVQGNSGPSPLASFRLRYGQTEEEARSLIEAHLSPEQTFQFGYEKVHASAVSAFLQRHGTLIGDWLGKILVTSLRTEQRLADCHPAPNFSARDMQSGEHPFHEMYRNEVVEVEVSDIFRRAFKCDLVIHRANQNGVPAYVGQRPRLKRGEHHHSRGYLDRLEALDRLESQGDGMRSFASIAARMIAGKAPIMLVDEPEAFLHPPQARLIGACIGEAVGRRQVIVATHSSDVLQGVITSNSTSVDVIRLERQGGKVTAAHLPPEQVAELWNDPILRFSNVLDGLFHDAVVVCEADADCRFYDALASSAIPQSDRPDIQYTYCGGKDRVAIVVSALKAVGVRVASILDFDALNNEQPLKRIVEAHQGRWSDIQRDWSALKEAIEARGTHILANELASNLRDIAKGLPAKGAAPKDALRQLTRLARDASPWDVAKNAGLAAVPSGKPTETAKRLLSQLSGLGIFIVPCGEMESFNREIGSHGPRWVEEALTRSLSDDPNLAEARAFAQQVIAFTKKA